MTASQSSFSVADAAALGARTSVSVALDIAVSRPTFAAGGNRRSCKRDQATGPGKVNVGLENKRILAGRDRCERMNASQAVRSVKQRF
jgi:hypothetical protein